MVCPNCGNSCENAKFCPECGTKLDVQNPAPADIPKKTVPRSICQANVNGREINLLKVVVKYGANTPRVYSYLRREYGISKEQATELLAPFEAQVVANKTSRKNIFATAAEELVAKSAEEAKRKSELDAAGQVYCPKCLSTSISANKRGYSVIRARLWGIAAGAIGSQKIICTCLKCGYQWKAGKK